MNNSHDKWLKTTKDGMDLLIQDFSSSTQYARLALALAKIRETIEGELNFAVIHGSRMGFKEQVVDTLQQVCCRFSPLFKVNTAILHTAVNELYKTLP